MSVRRSTVSTSAPVAASATSAQRFTLDNDALRVGVARSLAPRVALACEMDNDIRALSQVDNYLIHALNAPYLEVYPGTHPSPTVLTHVNSIEYSTNAYMEHNLSMKLVSQGSGNDTTMTFTISSQPNLIQDQDTGVSEMPTKMPTVNEIYNRTDDGCYKLLFENAYTIEQDWKYKPSNQEEMNMGFMSGAPYFSAIGIGLEAMLEASSNDFTGTQAMNNGNEIPLHNQIRFLITHYATAVQAFKSKKQLAVLHQRARDYQAGNK